MKSLKKILLAFGLLLTFTGCDKGEKEDVTAKLDQVTIQKLIGEWEIVGYIGTSAQTIDVSTLEFGPYDNCSNNEKIKFNADFKSDYSKLKFGTGPICTLEPLQTGTWAYSNGMLSESTLFTADSNTATILEITATTLIINSKIKDSGFNRVFKLMKI